MADCSEEQQMEMEALEALFTHEGEFQKLSNTSFRLMLLPMADQPEMSQRLSVTIDVEYPPGYPETELPRWTIAAHKGCDDTALEALRRDVQAEMKKQLGTPMMYTIAEFIQEWLRTHGAAPVSMYDQMLNRETGTDRTGEEEDEEEEQPAAEVHVVATSSAALADKDLGDESNRCTKEEFDRWAGQFREEMIARGIWKGSCGRQQRGALTGRQLFERDASLATADTGEPEDADEAEEICKKETGGILGEECSSGRETNVMWKDENLFTGGDPEELPSD